MHAQPDDVSPQDDEVDNLETVLSQFDALNTAYFLGTHELSSSSPSDHDEQETPQEGEEYSNWLKEQCALTAALRSMYSSDSSVEEEEERGDAPQSRSQLPAAQQTNEEPEDAPQPEKQRPTGLLIAHADSHVTRGRQAAAFGELAPDFVAKARAWNSPLLSSLLLGETDPSSVGMEELLRALGRQADSCSQRAVNKDFDVMSIRSALSPASCARLREAVDRERCTVPDSVDGLPEHQLRLSQSELGELIGADDLAALMRLPIDWVRKESKQLGSGEDVDTATVEKFGRLEEAFVRRYSAGTRPWNVFHQDRARLTVNVAVSADSAHTGGRLLGVFGGRIHTLERDEGDATVHSSDLFHAVTAMTDGVRYSLIMFFDPDSVEELYSTRLAGVKNSRVRRFLADVFVGSDPSRPTQRALAGLILK